MTAQVNDFGFTSFNDLEKDKDEHGFTPFEANTSPEPLPHPEPEDQEGWGKWLVRTLYQIPSGYAKKWTYPLDLLSLIATAEATDPEEITHIRMISEREGIPFDEDKYMEAVRQAQLTFPTQSNIERGLEYYLGAPLTPKTTEQKLINLGSAAAGFAPSSVSQKAIAAGTAPTIASGLEHTGVPEEISELAGLAASQPLAAVTKPANIGIKTKPSGLPSRQFENVNKPKEVSEGKIQQINKKLESDFKGISDKIIKDSPIGETAHNLANDPTFKQESRELLNQAQVTADAIPGNIPVKSIKKEYADISAKKVKGFALNEYDKSYMKFMKEAIEDILPENVTHGELVENYRKNNASLGEYFEPGSSKALNRAKKDALLDQNRAIAKIIEKSDPELAEVFKEGNARWTKIMDAEAVDNFVNELFTDKINYKKMHDFFDKNGYDFIFKRALGEKGYNNFQQLMKDMLTSEVPYKMLKIAQNKGWNNLVTTASSFILHPKLGYAKIAYDVSKRGYKALMNLMLDKPKLGFTFKEAIQNLKAGKFAEAEKKFEILNSELEKSNQ